MNGAPIPPGMWQPPVPGAPAPAAKKGSNKGCLIALAVVGGLLLLMAIGVAALFYKAASSPEGRKVLGFMRDATAMSRDALTAPGAKEVRALGCDQAMVMDMNAMIKTFAGDAGLPAAGDAPMVMVMCQVGPMKTPPSCPRIASTYVKAVGTPKGAFQVMVQQQMKMQPVCMECYTQAGEPTTCQGTGRSKRRGKVPAAPVAPAGDD